jgi:uroporphyrinogen-III synthase
MSQLKKQILYLGLDPSRYPHDGHLLHLPLIQTTPSPYQGEIQKAFERLDNYTHVLFTSRTPIPIYEAYAQAAGFSTQLKKKIYLSIGQATTQRLTEFALTPSYTAQEQTGEGVIALLKTLSFQNAHLFFPHSARARRVIPHYLAAAKIPFTSIALYQTHLNPLPLPDLDTFDEIVFTSPSTVHAFYTLAHRFPPSAKCIALGPITQKSLLAVQNQIN